MIRAPAGRRPPLESSSNNCRLERLARRLSRARRRDNRRASRRGVLPSRSVSVCVRLPAASARLAACECVCVWVSVSASARLAPMTLPASGIRVRMGSWTGGRSPRPLAHMVGASRAGGQIIARPGRPTAIWNSRPGAPVRAACARCCGGCATMASAEANCRCVRHVAVPDREAAAWSWQKWAGRKFLSSAPTQICVSCVCPSVPLRAAISRASARRPSAPRTNRLTRSQ